MRSLCKIPWGTVTLLEKCYISAVHALRFTDTHPAEQWLCRKSQVVKSKLAPQLWSSVGNWKQHMGFVILKKGQMDNMLHLCGWPLYCTYSPYSNVQPSFIVHNSCKSFIEYMKKKLIQSAVGGIRSRLRLKSHPSLILSKPGGSSIIFFYQELINRLWVECNA